MKKALDFLNLLHANNNKAWFDDNKKLYLEAQGEFNEFTIKLIEGIERFDRTVKNIQLKDCIYRIYRDARFSHDKTPYKTHFGSYVCPGGKKSGYAGYYFHIEANGADYIGTHLLASGLYCPEPKVIKSIRTDIFDDPKHFVELVDQATDFTLSTKAKLKRVPKGFPSDFEHADYLMCKDYTLMKPMSSEEILSPQLLGNVLADFERTCPFIGQLNKATEFAFKEM